ncbi:GAP family protein [Streptomyces sp. NPDC100445]|uniref:GAP family protein n=1 Tax=Streptomyces sp. NPDC100445 TaxID=3366102 RepID=UPI00382048CE
MLPDLLLVALAIALDPLPLMSFVLVVGSARGVWKGLVFILSWLACLVMVIALVLTVTGGQPPAPRSPPSTAVLAVKLLAGVLLVGYGGHRRRRVPGSRDREPAPDPGPAASARLTDRMDRTTVWAAAGLAVLVQPWGLVAAGATTVLEADTSHLSTWFVLCGFCLLATAELLAVELYVVFSPVRAKARLLRLREWLTGHQEQALVTVCLVLGCWLVGKSLYQLTA